MVDDICNTCGKTNPPKSKRKATINWICCDKCLQWFHTSCVGIREALVPDLGSYWYQCEKCCISGDLIPKTTSTSTGNNVSELLEKIQDLSSQVEELRAELKSVQSNSKKQVDRIQSRIAEAEQSNIRQSAHCQTLTNIGQKMELIESGAKLAGALAGNTNSCRLAINKVPVKKNENVNSLVENIIQFLGLPHIIPQLVTCFRIPSKPSKWTDRSVTPTIIAVFADRGAKETVLRRYFEVHKDAKLCALENSFPLEYRFTVNEVLSLNTFRIRNLALRLKQQKLVESVFVRNDRVSVRLPGQKRYCPVHDTEHLTQITNASDEETQTSIFFDARSANSSFVASN